MSEAGITRRVLGLSVPVTEMLDPVLWRQRYAHGVTLGPDREATADLNLISLMCQDGDRPKGTMSEAQSAFSQVISDIPDEVIRWHLRAAVSELEIKLGMPLGVVVYKSPPITAGLVQGQHYDVLYPRQPFLRSSADNWYRFDLPSNVISVDRVRMYWFDQLVWDVDTQLVSLEHPKQGSGHIIPTTASNLFVNGSGFSAGNFGAWQLITSMGGPVPGVWGVDFTCGPRDEYGSVGQVEAVLAHWVYCVAGQLLLSIGGLAKSQGLTSASISMDGLSRSIGLQASAIYGVNSALENALEKATKRIDWQKLKIYKQGLRIIPYGR